MQSYQEYLVSEFLADRHPYLQMPFTSEIDPEQVTLGVFFRQIPKLADCLTFESLPDSLRRDALHTLNELVFHQETKDDAINMGVIQSCAALMDSESWPVRMEAALLIGGTATLMQGRDLMVGSEVFPQLQTHLRDKVREVREAVSWTLFRISLSRDGVDRIVETGTVSAMVNTFIKFVKKPKLEDKMHLLYLLEAFRTVTAYDDGILPVLGTGFLAALLRLLTLADVFTPEPADIIREKTLGVISHIILNPEGKKEATELQAIKAVAAFLNGTPEQKRMAATVIMTTTIALDGKHQAIESQAGEKAPVLMFLYGILQGDLEYARVNAKQTLQNIADLPAGFDKACDILSANLDILDEVYGFRAVKPLVRLLPKLNTYSNPPAIEAERLADYQQYLKALHFLKKKYPETDDQLVDTVNIAEKLGPFLNEASGVSKETVEILRSVCSKDPHNAQVLKRFIQAYGDHGIKREMVKYPDFMTIIN